MQDKRHYSNSALTPDGNLWIIGGSHGSKRSKITEVYEYQPNSLGKWRNDLPLPIELQKSGIDNQCIVTVNSTHVFMAGGFQVYRKDSETGGKPLDSAWMFDGSSWKALANMSTTRDRSACSLVYMNDRSVSFLKFTN